MAPVPPSKTKLFVHQSTDSEEFLTSKDFLESHIRYGLWLRPLSARHLLKSYSEDNPSPAESVAFEASLYQAYGACIEDLLTSIIAFYLWKLDIGKPIADVFNQIILAPTEDAETTESTEPHYAVQEKFLGSGRKKLRVNPHSFLKSLIDNTLSEELPGLFGIHWKKYKSRKSFESKQDRELWEVLPEIIGELLDLLNQRVVKLIGKSHNKIKHGPQIHVISVEEEVRAIKGQYEATTKLPRSEKLLQILLCGSLVGGSQQDLATGRRIAPILYPGPDNLKRILHMFIVKSILNWSMVLSFLRNQMFQDLACLVFPDDSGILSLLYESYEFNSTSIFRYFDPAKI